MSEIPEAPSEEIPPVCDQACHSNIVRRLDEGDRRFKLLETELSANTTATQQIADNTAGIVRLTTELEAGTKFLCRVAMGIRFILKDVVEPFWKPALIVFVVVYVVIERRLPDWIGIFLKAVEG